MIDLEKQVLIQEKEYMRRKWIEADVEVDRLLNIVRHHELFLITFDAWINFESDTTKLALSKAREILKP